MQENNTNSALLDDAYPKPAYANYVLGILMMAYVFSFIDRQILSLMVGPIKADLDIGDFQFSLLTGWAFALFYAFMGIPLGRMADHRSRRAIIAVGVAVWSLMTCLSGMAKSFNGLFMARVGVGVGEAALSPPAYSLLSDYYPPHRLARANSIYTMGVTIGSGLAYIIGGFVSQWIAGMGEISLPLVGEVRAWQATFLRSAYRAY